MKTNVSIKFNSIEEYVKIKIKLNELGCTIENSWDTVQLIAFEGSNKPYYVFIDDDFISSIYSFSPSEIYYNSLKEFLDETNEND